MENAPYKYFVKGDISGIQDFIFNVKSEGAAKALKGRSFFVSALNLLAVKMIRKELALKDSEEIVFYNGGGNFYLKLNKFSNENLKSIRAIINETCAEQDFYLTISCVETTGKTFGKIWSEVNLKAEKEKLQKFSTSYFDGFSPYENPFYEDESDNEESPWKKLARGFKLFNGYDFKRTDRLSIEVDEKGVNAFGFKLIKGDQKLEDIVLKMPRVSPELRGDEKMNSVLARWSEESREKDAGYEMNRGDLLEFGILAEFAKLRTGTKKIAVLKMDADNLGELFNFLPEQSAKRISELVSNFFKDRIEELLEENFSKNPKEQHFFKDNIYTVFSGGDDCFFVGAWDAVLYWAEAVQKAFRELSTSEVQKIITEHFGNPLPPKIQRYAPVTISAGFLMLEATYPVTRFSDFAEAALKEAKNFKFQKDTRGKKNKICMLDEVLNWDEFKKTILLAEQLRKMVDDKGESHSTIQKIRMSSTRYQEIRTEVLKGRLQGANISQLYYSLRHSKNIDELSRDFINPFSRDLMGAFTRNSESNPLKFPLAARIAEFMMRDV